MRDFGRTAPPPPLTLRSCAGANQARSTSAAVSAASASETHRSSTAMSRQARISLAARARWPCRATRGDEEPCCPRISQILDGALFNPPHRDRHALAQQLARRIFCLGSREPPVEHPRRSQTTICSRWWCGNAPAMGFEHQDGYSGSVIPTRAVNSVEHPRRRLRRHPLHGFIA